MINFCEVGLSIAQIEVVNDMKIKKTKITNL